MFPRIASSTSKPYYITVTRKGTVRYRYRKLVVKENGKTQYIVRNVNNLQVYNRIEGLLKFTGSAKPRNREFPGYGNVLQLQIATRSTSLLCQLFCSNTGFLRVGNGAAQYIQTLAEPSVRESDYNFASLLSKTLYACSCF